MFFLYIFYLREAKDSTFISNRCMDLEDDLVLEKGNEFNNLEDAWKFWVNYGRRFNNDLVHGFMIQGLSKRLYLN